MIDGKIYLETVIELDGPASGDDLNTEEDVTPRQRDFRADELSEDENEPVEMPSEADDMGEPWETPSALKQGRDAFQNDTDREYNSESEAEWNAKEVRKDNITRVRCQSKVLIVELMSVHKQQTSAARQTNRFVTFVILRITPADVTLVGFFSELLPHNPVATAMAVTLVF